MGTQSFYVGGKFIFYANYVVFINYNVKNGGPG
jgi:hypothetical protein